MDTLPAPPRCRGYRFPREIIANCNWLYSLFNFSFRDIQEMMFERRVEVSHEAIRVWLCYPKIGTKRSRCFAIVEVQRSAKASMTADRAAIGGRQRGRVQQSIFQTLRTALAV